MEKIAVIGANGKMGKLICETLKNSYEIIEIDKTKDINIARDCDLIIDFSTGSNSSKTAKWCEIYRKKLIIGATGQTNEENKLIKSASKNIPILMAGNFSIGISTLKNIFFYLKNLPSENIIIYECHHKNKKDAPSGTAKELKTFLKSLFNCKIDTIFSRGGEEIGLHQISFYFGSEVLKFSHQAFSRKSFIDGLIKTIPYMLKLNNPGLISFDNIIKSL